MNSNNQNRNRTYFNQYLVNLFDTPESAANSLAKEMLNATHQTIQKKGRCIWAVSGGSSILKIYDALSKHSDELRELIENLFVTWVDERVVPHSNEKSNFGNAYNYFWDNYADAFLMPVPYYKDAQKSAREYNFLLSRQGIERGSIDITLLGMGTDGHTASLFPKNKALTEKKRNIVAVEDPSVEVQRITMTYPFINSSNSIFCFFYGKDKATTFKKACLSKSEEKYPILGVDRKKLEIYTDQLISE